MSKQDTQELTRVTRKSLKTLQRTAVDSENLVGRPAKNLKHQLIQDSPVETVEVKRKNLSTKETQANLDQQVSVNDLTSPDGPSEKYWETLAEKRRIALEETLIENEKLRTVIETLKEENAKILQMLEEANSFVEVVKEELANCSNNDTGIDVNDVSAATEDDPSSTNEHDDTNDN